MQRVTLRIPKGNIDTLDEIVDAGIYPNRSEAVRATSADGGADTVTVEVTYHIEGGLGAQVFGLDQADVHPDDVRVVEFADGYAALEPSTTVRDLFARTRCPGDARDDRRRIGSKIAPVGISQSCPVVVPG